MILDIGSIVAAKYRIDGLLGRGGMGVVMSATHLELKEKRAIKFLLPDTKEPERSILRFMREAQAAAKLKSQHVAKVFDVGRVKDTPYMVMEFLDGVSFSSLLRLEQKLAVGPACGMMMQAMEAVDEAHDNGIIHRDLKPANLFLARGLKRRPIVKVLDFGISKLVDKKSGMDITRTTTLLGSPHYMSPEQMMAARDTDGRADIWALGVILYQLLTGRLPFSGESITQLSVMVVAHPAPPPTSLQPNIPLQLEAVIMRCLEKRPSDRFSNVEELMSAVEPFATRLPAVPHISGEVPHVAELASEPSGNKSNPAAMVAASPDNAVTTPRERPFLPPPRPPRRAGSRHAAAKTNQHAAATPIAKPQLKIASASATLLGPRPPPPSRAAGNKLRQHGSAGTPATETGAATTLQGGSHKLPMSPNKSGPQPQVRPPMVSRPPDERPPGPPLALETLPLGSRAEHDQAAPDSHLAAMVPGLQPDTNTDWGTHTHTRHQAPPSHRNRWLAALAAAFVLVLGISAGFLSWSNGSSGNSQEPASATHDQSTQPESITLSANNSSAAPDPSTVEVMPNASSMIDATASASSTADAVASASSTTDASASSSPPTPTPPPARPKHWRPRQPSFDPFD